jgi:hypothetical protein
MPNARGAAQHIPAATRRERAINREVHVVDVFCVASVSAAPAAGMEPQGAYSYES